MHASFILVQSQFSGYNYIHFTLYMYSPFKLTSIQSNYMCGFGICSDSQNILQHTSIQVNYCHIACMEKILDLFLEVYPSIISIMFHRISIKLIV